MGLDLKYADTAYLGLLIHEPAEVAASLRDFAMSPVLTTPDYNGDKRWQAVSMTAPKVFLSHAGEDKDRFVLKFATALRIKGIDVWVDRWEMRPGDSLVDKIFEEGIKNAAAVIVVLSNNSVSKPWVREELNAAVIKRIESGSKLIPVLIDTCEVPQALRSTVWERVDDLDNIQGIVDRVSDAIFDHRPKPTLGTAPIYSSPEYQVLPGLSPIDTFVLGEASKDHIEKDSSIIEPAQLFLSSDPPRLSKQALIDAVEVLEQHMYVKAFKHIGAGPYPFRVTTSGLELYLANNLSRYNTVVRDAIALVVNENVMNSADLATRLSIPHAITRHVLNYLEMRGHLRLSNTIGSTAHIITISASLRRSLAT